ncbi:MAG: type II secretion system major pseudopilin GspG [Fuerstiella sp.]|nr:type II secretion system major pseudopilin GspG [Fuerstiella sp.]
MYFSQNSSHRRTAFTLMEVLLVLAIMGVIMTLVMPKLMSRQVHANTDATRISIAGVHQALKLYSLDHLGNLPSTAEGMSCLVLDPGTKDPHWRGPYLEELPRDAWGTELQYQFPGNDDPSTAEISSAGPDLDFGTDDDITRQRD